jgi:alpha-L-rhamnosidase
LVALGILLASLAVGLFGAAIHKVRSTERAIIASGILAGTYFPDDKINAIIRPYPHITQPAALIAINERPLLISSIKTNSVYDFGNTAFGALRLIPLSLQKQAVTIEVRLGERLDPGGHVWQHTAAIDGMQRLNVASVRTSVTIAVGQAPTIIEESPRFRPKRADLPSNLNAVSPFRYVEITGLEANRYQVERIAVRYPFNDGAATFRSSDPVLNLIWRTGVHSIKATSFAGIYVDGNRERRPYEADAYINQLGHYSIDEDYRLARHTLEYLIGNPSQFSEWLMFPVLIAYNDYLYSGDIGYLRSIYSFLRDRSFATSAASDETIGDWQMPKGAALARTFGLGTPIVDLVDWPESERDSFAVRRTAPSNYLYQTAKMVGARSMARIAAVTGNANAATFYAMSADGFDHRRYRLVTPNTVTNSFRYATLRRLAYLAGALGKEDDRRRFDTAADKLRGAIVARFFDRPMGLFRDGGSSTHHSVHANLFPMAFGLVSKPRVAKVADFIASRDMPVGVYGAQFLLDALYAAGRGDTALARLQSTSDRSWYGMVARTGSTITTEAWNDRVKPNQDWNHAWGAAPVNLIARGLMGIVPIEPGFTAFAVRPQPGALQWANIRVPTVRGGIVVAYRADPKMVSLSVTVPPGTRATLGLAKANVSASAQFQLDGRDVWPSETETHFEIENLRSGHHRLDAKRL